MQLLSLWSTEDQYFYRQDTLILQFLHACAINRNGEGSEDQHLKKHSELIRHCVHMVQ
jgi:hypothetical protein